MPWYTLPASHASAMSKLLPHLNDLLIHSCFRFALLLQPSRHIRDLSLDWLGILLLLSLSIKLGTQCCIVCRVGKYLLLGSTRVCSSSRLAASSSSHRSSGSTSVSLALPHCCTLAANRLFSFFVALSCSSSFAIACFLPLMVLSLTCFFSSFSFACFAGARI